MTENKRFKFNKDTVATNLKTPIVYDGERMSIGEVLDKLNELSEENKELKKQLGREQTDKKRLMSLLMKYKGYSFDEIVEDILDEPYYDNWWEDGFYESCWKEYIEEKGLKE